MPGYRGHMVGALVIWALCVLVLFAWSVPLGWQTLEWGVATVLGAFFPDLDTKSMGQKWLYRVLFLVGLVCMAEKKHLWAASMLLVASIPLMLPHRGLMHSPLFIVVFSGILVCVAQWYLRGYGVVVTHMIFFFALGALSHIFLDAHFS